MNKIPITFTCYLCNFDDGDYTVFLFWPDGEWDENKLSLEEALEAYPIDKYEWMLLGE